MRAPRHPAKILALAAILVAGSLAGYDAAVRALTTDAESGDVSGPAPNSVDSVTAAKAVAQLESILVKDRAPKTGYSRDEFRPGLGGHRTATAAIPELSAPCLRAMSLMSCDGAR
jgi:hypothetical protein